MKEGAPKIFYSAFDHLDQRDNGSTMISSPWRSVAPVEPERPYVALLGVVRLKNIRILPAFVQYGIKIEKQLKRSGGVIGYRTAVKPLSLVFYHLSAWTDADAISAFVHTEPHLRALQKMTGRLGETAFRYWQIDGSAIPLHMHAEIRRP